jgi:hypothetical protein
VSPVVHRGFLYFGEKKLVRRMPAEGGQPRTLVFEDEDIDAVAVDDDHVYWAVHNRDADVDGGGIIKRKPLDGGPTVTIAAELGFRVDGYQKFVTQMSVDATHLYWLHFTGYSVDYRVYRVNK